MLLGGGVVLVLLLAVLFAGTAAAPRLLAWGLATTRDRVLGALPAPVTPVARRHLRQDFDCVIARAESGAISEEELGALSRLCNAALADRELQEGELLQIRAALQALCPGSRRP